MVTVAVNPLHLMAVVTDALAVIAVGLLGEAVSPDATGQGSGFTLISTTLLDTTLGGISESITRRTNWVLAVRALAEKTVESAEKTLVQLVPLSRLCCHW